jgi:hypothetical protein
MKKHTAIFFSIEEVWGIETERFCKKTKAKALRSILCRTDAAEARRRPGSPKQEVEGWKAIPLGDVVKDPNGSFTLEFALQTPFFFQGNRTLGDRIQILGNRNFLKCKFLFY